MSVEKSISQELMNTIATYMNDEIREDLHCELAPCTPEEFLIRYVELDKEFANLLYREFHIDMDELVA